MVSVMIKPLAFALAIPCLGSGGYPAEVPNCEVVGCAYANPVVEDFETLLRYYRENEPQGIAGRVNLEDGRFVRELQGLLHFHGYLDKEPDAVLDEETLDAVKTYKRKNGLPGSGVNRPFLDHLSTPSSVRVKLLEEALDALGRFGTANDIYVNIPEFKLRYYYGGELQFGMDVVVGSGKQKGKGKGERWVTGVQGGVLECAVINPYWNVPSGDLADEVRGYLGRSSSLRANMEQRVDGAWVQVVDDFSGDRFRQRPGPWNLLGRIEYDFHGDYGQFLHGTPGKELFKFNVRNFSHGCMRLEDEFALFRALQDVGVIDPTIRVDKLVDEWGYRTREVMLSEPVSVHVVYLRAWVDHAENGLLMVMPPDIYGYRGSLVP